MPLISIGGVEADDVIGTLAVQATEQQQPVIISTGDKDIAQLVNQHISLVNTMTDTVLDSEGVVAKFGIPPQLIIDYLALLGDKSDNIPGVPGVGEKTALALLQGLGGLDSIYENLDKVAELTFRGAKTMAEKLQANRELAYLSYQLATIKTDVEMELSVAQLINQPPDETILLALFKDMEFKTWINELSNENGSAPSEQPMGDNQSEESPTVKANSPKDYETVLSAERFEFWLQQLQTSSLMAIDTETTGLDYMSAQLVGVSVAVEAGRAAYIPFGHDYLGVPQQLSKQQVLC